MHGTILNGQKLRTDIPCFSYVHMHVKSVTNPSEHSVNSAVLVTFRSLLVTIHIAIPSWNYNGNSLHSFQGVRLAFVNN